MADYKTRETDDGQWEAVDSRGRVVAGPDPDHDTVCRAFREKYGEGPLLLADDYYRKQR